MTTIRLSNQEIKIDEDDLDLIEKYSYHISGGYAVRWGYKYGKHLPIGLHIDILNKHNTIFIRGKFHTQGDHKDRDKLNYCKSNLRWSSGSQNHANKAKRNLPNLHSKYKGVTWEKCRGYFKAVIERHNIAKTILCSTIEIECAFAYNVAAKILFKEFAYLNDIGNFYSKAIERDVSIKVVARFRLDSKFVRHLW